MIEKNSERLTFYSSPELELELRRLAADDGRELSDYIRWVVKLHVYGHRRTAVDDNVGMNRPE